MCVYSMFLHLAAQEGLRCSEQNVHTCCGVKALVAPLAMCGPDMTGPGPGSGSCAHGSAAALGGSLFVPTQDWYWLTAQWSTWSLELEAEENGRGCWLRAHKGRTLLL